MIPLDIPLDRTVLKSREGYRYSEVINLAKARIRSKLQGKRGRKSKPETTSMQAKKAWAKNSMDHLYQEDEVGASQPQSLRKKTPRKWARQRWKEGWDHYLSTVPESKRTPAHRGDLGQQRDKLLSGVRCGC